MKPFYRHWNRDTVLGVLYIPVIVIIVGILVYGFVTSPPAETRIINTLAERGIHDVKTDFTFWAFGCWKREHSYSFTGINAAGKAVSGTACLYGIGDGARIIMKDS